MKICEIKGGRGGYFSDESDVHGVPCCKILLQAVHYYYDEIAISHDQVDIVIDFYPRTAVSCLLPFPPYTLRATTGS